MSQRRLFFFLSPALFLLPPACGGDDNSDSSSGGASLSGGAPAQGGNANLGGKPSGGRSGGAGEVSAAGAGMSGAGAQAGESAGGTGITGGVGGMASGGSDAGGAGGVGGGGSVMAAAIAVGRLHSCAVTTAVAVVCWGATDHGQVGNGVIDPSSDGVFSSPVAVEGLSTGATSVSSFGDHTCAVVSGGVMCWGANDQGQLGDGTRTESAVPVAVSGLTSGVVAVAAGESHTCALTDAGAVQCWGKNDYGQLGDGSSVDYSLMPVTVTGMSSGVKAIAAGLGHSCAVTSGGTAKCWGSNLYGELGMGTSGSGMHTPTTVAGLTSGATSVAAGANLSCGTTSAGRVLCWGRNDDGQVGNGRSGTQALEETAVAVDGVSSGATAVSAGYGFTCAVISGAAKCWGNNFYLVLGNGEAPGFSSPTPVAVSGLSSGVTAIAASSSDHACALTAAGAVKCWGSAGGALGGGNSDDAPTPIGVVGFP